MPHCPSCGAALREGARFCPDCGAAVGAPQAATTSGPPGKAAPGVAKQPMLVGPPPPSPALAPPPPVAPPPPTTASLSSPRGMSGTWVAVFISYYTEQEAQAYLSEVPPGSQVLQSDGYSSLRPGYWIVYHDGGFDTGREAADFCRSVGRTSPQDCFARFLTTDPDASPTDPDLNVDP